MATAAGVGTGQGRAGETTFEEVLRVTPDQASAETCPRRTRSAGRLASIRPEQAGESGSLVLVQAADRVVGDARAGDTARWPRAAAPDGRRVSTVNRPRASLSQAFPADQTLALEPVDQPGQPAACQQHPRGQLPTSAAGAPAPRPAARARRRTPAAAAAPPAGRSPAAGDRACARRNAARRIC